MSEQLDMGTNERDLLQAHHKYTLHNCMQAFKQMYLMYIHEKLMNYILMENNQ